jgi:hypothetical protein
LSTLRVGRVPLLELPEHLLLRGISMRRRQPAECLPLLDDVDTAPVGEHGDGDPCHALHRRLVLQRRGENRTGFIEQPQLRHALLERHGRFVDPLLELGVLRTNSRVGSLQLSQLVDKLEPKPPSLHGARYGCFELLGIARLGQVVVRSPAQRTDSRVERGISGEHDGHCLRRVLAQERHDLEAVHVVQPEVDQRDVERRFLQEMRCDGTCRGCGYSVVGLLEHGLHRGEDALLIIDDQDAPRHLVAQRRQGYRDEFGCCPQEEAVAIDSPLHRAHPATGRMR